MNPFNPEVEIAKISTQLDGQDELLRDVKHLLSSDTFVRKGTNDVKDKAQDDAIVRLEEELKWSRRHNAGAYMAAFIAILGAAAEAYFLHHS
jgi:hypothetical protein